MAYRSRVQRILAHCHGTREKLSLVPLTVSSFSRSSPSFPPSVGAAVSECLISRERGKYEGPSSGWMDLQEKSTSPVVSAESFCSAAAGVSSRGFDRESEGSSSSFQSIKRTPGHLYWDGTVGLFSKPDEPQEYTSAEFFDTVGRGGGSSSTRNSRLGNSGIFCAQSYGIGTFPIISSGLPNGSMNRSFSSNVAACEGTKIPVEEGHLDTLESVLGGVNDTAASSVAQLPSSSSLSEVAVAAADSSFPTAFVQYVIDGVHVTTGLPWWASIALTTVAIRILVLPILIHQMKSTARLTLMRPELEKLTNRIKESDYDPKVVEDNKRRMTALFTKHKTSPFSPIVGAFVQAPIFMCFFFAIRNMAEKMESFKQGGALWFMDLSTPDTLFIMPVLSGAFFLLTVELGATDGMQGQPMVGKMKMVLRGLSVLLVPLTASFPKALFCYWLTANLFSIGQAAVFKQPKVKAILGIPDVSHMAKGANEPVGPVVTYRQRLR